MKKSVPLREAAQILRDGGLVVMPTETVYGLAANALDKTAVKSVFALKGRPSNDPLIVHVLNSRQMEQVAVAPSAMERRLMRKFWPGPLTFVLRKKDGLPRQVTSGLPTVAVRSPAHPVARQLLRAARIPLAAPSANRFGQISPTTAAAVREEFGAECPLLLDGGHCLHGMESTIIRCEPDHILLLRAGAIPVETLCMASGLPVIEQGTSSKPVVPGQLPRHYAPRTPLKILPATWRDQRRQPAPQSALLLFRDPLPGHIGPQIVLSPRGNLAVAARRFYASLRKLDRSGANFIWAESFPEEWDGIALNDRLRRASHRK
jgi:L-threonylcarbamoyladenylate synthase